MSDCLFCRIARREIPAKVAHEDDRVVAFHDINPQAPTHLVVIPKTHIAKLSDLSPATAPIMTDLVLAANQLAARFGLVERGYRIVVNCGMDAGQTIGHLHLHLLGGRALGWPPG